ncbi:DUF5333 domain-containing protein [Paracoccus sp. WLY502]|uniref:DUF5333 domain-containing protein n=1 Tax=Paracoccus yibinensis TaxID=3068891 RepID=UPI0027964AAC|nr:DUF5333 domain-containing protein [Paracoccus sp. WLY502]MDQ1899228.1 DUF5333 domain-containing protein [Paracoccus sp. WLY502]
MTGRAAYRGLARAALVALSLAAAPASPAAALPPLSQERHVNDSLVQARVADLLRRGCPDLDARIIKAFSEARKLKRYALEQGYSEAQIDAFLDSREERRRIYAQADRYMVANGVVNGQPETFCRLGRQEIERKTIAGSLLVAR